MSGNRPLPDPALRPQVSIVIPAYNAAPTIGRTLDSLQQQTHAGWEAVVVNDGSTDRTAVVVSQYIQQDSRIILLHQANAGASAARNTGIRASHAPWMVFLDADDWLAPEFLETTLQYAADHPAIDIVHTGWARVTPDGRIADEHYGPPESDLFPRLARSCVVHIGGCLVRRSPVEQIGGFEASLFNANDWDFWQRIARAGARFGPVPKVLTFYQMRRNSLSRNLEQHSRNGMQVLLNGHRPDPRVPHPNPLHAQGNPREEYIPYRLSLMTWYAGFAIGQGQDGRRLFSQIQDSPDPECCPDYIAGNLFDACLLPECYGPSDWYQVWGKIQEPLEAFLEYLEAIADAPDLAKRSAIALERRILEVADVPFPVKLRHTYGVSLEVTQPIADQPVPAGYHRLFGAVLLHGKQIGFVELPVCDGQVRGWVLRDAIATKLAWPTFEGFLQHRGLDVPEAEKWTCFLQQIWGRPDWSGDQFYNPTTPEDAPTQDCPDPFLILDLRTPLPNVRLQGNHLTVLLTLGTAAIGTCELDAPEAAIQAQALRSTLITATGYHLCRVCIREGLIGRDWTSLVSLHDALQQVEGTYPAALWPSTTPAQNSSGPNDAVAASESAESAESVFVLPRKAWLRNQSPHRVAISRVEFPQISRLLLREIAQTLQEPALASLPLNLDPNRPFQNQALSPVVYNPDWILPDLGKNLPDLEPQDSDAAIPSTHRLPILRYPQITAQGDRSSLRWHGTPETLEAQLAYLQQQGYYSVRLADGQAAWQRQHPFPGRPILLTFEVGYASFMTDAWPLLKRYGFSAVVFVATERVGKTQDWPLRQGQGQPLLSWAQMQQLQQEGVEFGSHGTTYRPLTGLSVADRVEEVGRSRLHLHHKLGTPPLAFAYPYGDGDAIAAQLVAACGYPLAVSWESWISELTLSPWQLPRLEIHGAITLETFKQLLQL